MDAPKNLMQRLAAVMREVAYIRKEKKVENYMAVTHDQVTAEVRQWFIAHGIGIYPQCLEAQTVETGAKSSKGTPLIRFEGMFQINFVNVDNPADAMGVVVPAHANDYGDKAPGKALSYATKAALLKVLMIETGENDESRVGPELTPDAIVEYEERMSEAKSKDELRAVLEEALAEAKDCQDRYAARRLKRFAEKKAGGFNEFMPKAADDAPQGQQGGEPAPQQAEPPAGVDGEATGKPAQTGPVATAGMIKTIVAALARTGKTGADFHAKFGFDVEQTPKASVNEAISWARS